MNESQPDLSDLALFQIVATSPSLTNAAQKAGVPLPTMSRRMAHLERSTGRRLFLRGKGGFQLTQDGQSLADELTGLPELRHRVLRWLSKTDQTPTVRITAGLWTSQVLAQSLPATVSGTWAPSFVPSNAILDIARREADIGIRNAEPDHPWLARQKLRSITYAIYATSDAVSRYVSLPGQAPLPPSQAWLHRTHGSNIGLTATDMRLCLDLARSGHGRIVLPCFIGAKQSTLTQLSDQIEDLTHDEWLVSHHDTRHDPPIRAALSAIKTALQTSG